jgi:hypothetical protein
MTLVTGDLMRASLANLRSILIRGLAVVAVLLTYAVSSIGTQVATSIGIASLTLTAASTPAEAGWGWGRRRYRRGYWWGARRSYYRRRWW